MRSDPGGSRLEMGAEGDVLHFVNLLGAEGDIHFVNLLVFRIGGACGQVFPLASI